MLSLQQAYEVKASILEYLKATFGFREQVVEQAFNDFINDEKEGLFKGPYISLKLPFVKAAANEEMPLDIRPPFPPFDHQIKSFHRLTTKDGNEPKPTILTTGTGSGKTESFLYPVLDYCYQQKERRGIKVIILYPMNALATDQASRLAEAIWNEPLLKGKVTAGLFIGEGRDAKDFPKMMGETNIIENRNAIRDAPPDILLTNFKMLDYALMRAKYQGLWAHNFRDTSLLKFLVLDELHTYDGAQGSDVANLIRRLKLKLKLGKGQLCPVGTSATIGSGDDAPQLLAEYAGKVFGETFDPTAIITEKRLTTEEFFGVPKEALRNLFPNNYQLSNNALQEGETYDSYLDRQKALWGIDPKLDALALGDQLRQLKIVWDIVELCSSELRTVSDLIAQLNRINEEFRKVPELDEQYNIKPKEAVISSILALLAAAKTGQLGGRLFPLFYVQVQLWIRELSGLLRVVDETPTFAWRKSSEPKNDKHALPAYFCRECGASGWLMVKHDNRNKFESDVNEVYTKFFNNHKHIFFVNTDTADHQRIAVYTPSVELHDYLQADNLEIYDRDLGERVPFVAYKMVNNNRNIHHCPECNTRNSLSIMGTRVSTLASITTSQILSSDLDKHEEKDRKILAFTNGVQDAAHQAGFIEARNYRFTFRSALQTVINENGTAIRLSDLQAAFLAYWQDKADESGQKQIAAYLYKFFPSDKAGEVQLSSYKNKDGSYKKRFVDEFNLRVQWEIATEFGFNAILGRTLEKTGTSAVHFDPERLALVYPAILPELEKAGILHVGEADFNQFLIGLLHRLRIRGGIDHPFLAKFRTGSLRLWDLNWNNDRRHYLNKGFGPRSRFPRMLTDRPDNRGVVDSTATRQENWFHAYFKKSFQLAPTYPDPLNEFYTILLSTLASPEIQILDEQQAQDYRNFCLRSDALIVEKGVQQFSCNVCGNKLRTTPNGANQLAQSKCITYRCAGDYEAVDAATSESENYYQQVYNRLRSPRIYATDHTGLLERKDRELKERDFKERPKFNSLNALVATSTLEMGIDIGDLNSAMNTGVPPLPSNFLQRIGRAGRKSGSALIINFAKNQAHDLFYFEDPVAMMAGEVNTPGCYLDAREILRRHFFAFCIDCWTTADKDKHFIPSTILKIKPASINLDHAQFFINRIIQFIKNKEQRLLKEFQSIYDNQVDALVFSELAATLQTERFYQVIKKAFRDLIEEYRAIQRKRRDIHQYIKDQKLGEQDEERLELKREIANLRGTQKAIEKRMVLEYMTNKGLLPNYAFPETGVSLNARVMPRRSEGSDRTPSPKDIEVVRSSRQAIKELIPDNRFYTQGFKLTITGLNVLSWEEESANYRYCSNCDHLADDYQPEDVTCPKCGDLSFGSTANQHRFLKLLAAKSFNNAVDATLDDTSEEREMEFALRSLHFRFDKGKTHGAYAMKHIPFGIEYVSNVEIMEVNAGLTSDFLDHSRTTTINHQEVPVAGYITCKYCGKSSTNTRKRNNRGSWVNKEARDYHFPYCRHKELVYQGIENEVFKEVFLYRKTTTEAIKILLPVQEFDSIAQISMFQAGIELGLRKYYRGNPQHIDIERYAEFNFQTQKFDRYLVLYDLIPGGTGYLSKLFNPDVFNEIVELAYLEIRDCTCQLRGKDGCYRCVFSYGNQYFRDELSRQKAEHLFARIRNTSENWDIIPNGLGKVTNTGYIEESDLEKRFIRVLRNLATSKATENWTFSEENIDGVIHYRLHIYTPTAQLEYFIQPQYQLGKSQGVQYGTRADFLIRCLSATINGQEWSNEDLQQIKPIAIYLDGYQYHATKENPRFENDVASRHAILESQAFYSWTLTYKDVLIFEDQLGDKVALDSLQMGLNSKIKTAIKGHPVVKETDSDLFARTNNLSRLIWILENVAKPKIIDNSIRYYLTCFQDKFGGVALKETDVLALIKNQQGLSSFTTNNKGATVYCALDKTKVPHSLFDFQLFSRVKDFQLQSALLVEKTKQDVDKKSWSAFWKLFNLMQFTGFETCHLEKMTDAFQVQFLTGKEEDLSASEIEETAPSTVDTAKVLTYYDEEYQTIIEQLLQHNIPFSQDGSFILMDEAENDVVAEAILGFRDAKIVLEPFDEENEQIFKDLGYQVVSIENFDINLVK